MKRILNFLSWMIPDEERQEWLREWEAELAHAQAEASRGALNVLAGASEDAARQKFRSLGRGASFRDLRFALRSLRRNPGFTSVAVLTLGLGLGANTAIYSVVNATMVKDLPLHEPGRLMVATMGRPDRSGPFSAPNYLDFKSEASSFSGVSALQPWDATLTGTGVPQRVARALVSADMFSTVGVEAILGRTFLPGEDQPGAAPVVVLDHGLWISAFAGQRDAIGSFVDIDAVAHQVVGVLPTDFRLPPYTAQIWVPLIFAPDALATRGRNNLRLVGRLADGASAEAAQSEATTIASRLAETYPLSNEGRGIILRPLHSVAVGDASNTMALLLGSVGILLLIACVNVMNLTLARGIARERELAVRVSLGAGRARLIAQILGETTLVSLMGGVLGAGLAFFLVDPITAVLPNRLAAISDVHVDRAVLGFAFVLSCVTGALAGLFPALKLSGAATRRGAGMMGALRTRGGGRSSGHRLVAAQFALATTLLVGAGLLLRSLSALYAVDLGMDTRGLTSLSVTLPVEDYPTGPLTIAGVESIMRELGAEPGVAGTAATSQLPLTSSNLTSSVVLEGQDDQQSVNSPHAALHVTTPGYFGALGIPVVSGRAFEARDVLGSELVGVVNRTAAEEWWPGEDPVGKTVYFAEDGEGNPITRTVVGVVDDVRAGGPDSQPRVEFHQPAAQTTELWRWFGREMYFVLSVQGTSVTAQQIRGAVQRVDPNLAVSGIQTMDDALDAAVATPRVHGMLIGAFALVALLLAAVGIYGVMAFSVRQRTKEIAVRVALGADQQSILGRTVGAGIRTAALGTVVGVAASYVLGRWLSSFLYGVGAADPGTYVAVTGLLALVTIAACLIPAFHAARMDPSGALRGE